MLRFCCRFSERTASILVLISIIVTKIALLMTYLYHQKHEFQLAPKYTSWMCWPVAACQVWKQPANITGTLQQKQRCTHNYRNRSFSKLFKSKLKPHDHVLCEMVLRCCNIMFGGLQKNAFTGKKSTGTTVLGADINRAMPVPADGEW